MISPSVARVSLETVDEDNTADSAVSNNNLNGRREEVCESTHSAMASSGSLNTVQPTSLTTGPIFAEED